MEIFPAIDLYENKAVRLFKGDYAQMTVYSEHPVSVAQDFEKQGAKYIHMVDLAGAKEGKPVIFPWWKAWRKTPTCLSKSVAEFAICSR